MLTWGTEQEEFEKRVNPNDRDQVNLLEEMRAHIKKVRTPPNPPLAPRPTSPLHGSPGSPAGSRWG